MGYCIWRNVKNCHMDLIAMVLICYADNRCTCCVRRARNIRLAKIKVAFVMVTIRINLCNLIASHKMESGSAVWIRMNEYLQTGRYMEYLGLFLDNFWYNFEMHFERLILRFEKIVRTLEFRGKSRR